MKAIIKKVLVCIKNWLILGGTWFLLFIALSLLIGIAYVFIYYVKC